MNQREIHSYAQPCFRAADCGVRAEVKKWKLSHNNTVQGPDIQTCLYLLLYITLYYV